MRSMLSSLGLSGLMIDGPITNPYTVGVAKGYIEAITKFEPPFLVLEDDATLVNNNPELSFTIPKDTDALYLGTSIYGRLHKQTTPGGVIAADAGKYMRVFNMLGFHAVLYLSKSYIEHTVNTLKKFILNPIGGCDDSLAESMWRYNIYCVKQPIFYQKDGRSDLATQHPITTVL